MRIGKRGVGTPASPFSEGGLGGGATAAMPPRSQQGFTLLGLLFLVTLLGLLLAAAGTTWHAAMQREKEAQLLFIGDQYRRALASYYRMSPGDENRYPKKLEELLLDPRHPNTVRHLRRLWTDPVGGGDWVLLRDEAGGIKGLHSPSAATPLKTSGFPKDYAAFEGAGHYMDWVFAADK
jgi:type II secretory pathway pseudopilin PulG